MIGASTILFPDGINTEMSTGQKPSTDVSSGQPIARGRTADIYTWEDGYVLKLFHNWFDLESIKYEAQIARAVQASGLPVPRVGDIIQLDGRNGLIYERVNGHSMLEALQRRPWRLFYYARRLAALQAQMHTRIFKIELPPQRQRLENKIRHANALPAQTQSAVLSLLNTLRDGDRICHGDFHPGNILLTAYGEVVIDWIDASLGNPLADVARSSILALGAAGSDQIPNLFMKGIIQLFHVASLHHYFSLCPGGEHEYQHWLPIVATARLSENIPELESWLVAQAQKNL